jgi:glycine/D-amino acid oxidase-like deaminating enzyme
MKTRIEGRCFWLRQAILPGEEDAPPLEGDQRADVAIVGGGYAGLWTAIEIKLRQPALVVAVVEADICGGGASGRNSGMVLPQWAKFEALAEFCGAAGAVALCRATVESVDRIESFTREQAADIEFRRDPWIWGATCESQYGAWQPIVDALGRAGEHPFRAVSRDEIAAMTGTSAFVGGIRTDCTATLQPAKLARALRRAVLAAGVRIHENSAMTRLERRQPVTVHTARGRLRAGRVVLAMNSWSAQLPELRPAILVIASDDAVTAPAPDLLERLGYKAGPIMNDSQTFVTGFRTTADHRFNPGITGGVIGFGGLGDARFEGRSHREADIRASVRRGFPTLADLPFVDSWYGPIDRTRSGLPLFGALPSSPDVFYGYGFSGNGVATTPLAGRILASLALDSKDEWSGCGLVRPVERWMPPEPFRYVGALAVRAAVRRKDRLAYEGRRPGFIGRRLAALAPGGIVTTRLSRP